MLVSEVMLQQTQVARVEPAYRAFVEAFPTPAACAAAGPAEVIRRWRGLGYNRRALNLHEAAMRITEDFDGRVPDSLDELLSLPGVGSYTARAVLVFAFEQPVGVVDTNVARLLARTEGRPLARSEVQSLADELVPSERAWAWAWNQGVLDLGALVCTARSPSCEACPVRSACRWQGGRSSADDPASGSAGVSGRQSPFEGSDRQGRGRLVDALRRGPVARVDLPAACGWPDDPDRVERIVAQLVGEGFAVEVGDRLVLP